MLLFLTLFAFAPRSSSIPSGPPAPHLSRDPFVQGRLSRQPAWLDFQKRWAGDWYVRWDERNGTPRFLGAPGIPAVQASSLVGDIARLAGVDPSELTLTRTTKAQGREIHQWTRRWRGAPVEGDQVALVLQQGRVGAVWVQLTPLHIDEQPRPGELVFSMPDRGQAVLTTRRDQPDAVTYTDRAGREIYRYDPRLFSTIELSCEERTVGDADITAPVRVATATDSSDVSEYTDDDGVTSLSGDLAVLLEGPKLRVTENSAAISVTGTDSFVMAGGTDLSRPAASVQHHVHVVRDWLGERWPEHAWLPEQILADVNQEGYGTCNAYYSSGTVNFLPPGSCNNLGRIADVIYHEYGHGVHDYILASGTFASDVSEGSADFVAGTLLDTPYIAPEFSPGWPYLRELDTDKVYPTDMVGESHNDGLIWASFLWNLREQWSASYGDEEGVALTDQLFLAALEQGPALTDLYEAVLVADDDDGDWSNGTPHDCELLELLDHHGLGPGAMGVYAVEHEPMGPQASATTAYATSVGLFSLSDTCGLADAPSLSLWYTTEPGTPLPMPGGEEGSGWTSLDLSEDGLSYLGEFPRAPANSQVRYYLRLVSSDGSETVTSYGNTPSELSSFWVGDRAALWCEDFEGDTSAWTHGAGLPVGDGPPGSVDLWAFGAPSGAPWKPDAAYDGALIAATGLEDEYLPSNASYLQSPAIDLSSDGLMRLLSYQRWLTVEDALYDQANLAVTVDGETTPLWSNPRTDAGTTALLDDAWTLHDLSLEPKLREADASEVSFSWSLSSDAGLEFGGWALDQVCVVELDDLPGHYRPDDLVAAATELEVTLEWSQPWVRPLSRTVLVRKLDSWPTSIEDGEILDDDTAPVWGEEKTVLDYAVSPGDTWYYAVFSVGGSEEDRYLDIVEGENGVAVAVPAPDSGLPDTGIASSGGEPMDTMEEELVAKPTGCGCVTGAPSAPVGLLWMVSLGIARRRRRSAEIG